MSAIEDLKNATAADAHRQIVDSYKRKMEAASQAKRELALEAQGAPPQLVVVSAAQLRTYQFPVREPFLYRDQTVFFRAGHLAEVVATRGLGKTMYLLTLALAASTGGSVLGYRAASPLNVLYVDGEMASNDIRDRVDMLSDKTKLTRTDRFRFIAADWQTDPLPRVDTPSGQAALAPHVDWADLIIFDNRSCLFDPEGEKDATAWQPAGDYLLSLRRRGKGVLLAHHTNRLGGARGHSKPEDTMDMIVKLTRPEDYSADQGARFTVELDKARGIYGAAAAPFLAHLTPTGWTIGTAGSGSGAVRRKILDYLDLAEKAGDCPKSANVAIQKASVNRTVGLRVWGEMLGTQEIIGDRKIGFRVGARPAPLP